MIQVPRFVSQDHKWLQHHALHRSLIPKYLTDLAIGAFGSRSGTDERDGVSCLSEAQIRGAAKDRGCKHDHDPICGQSTCQCWFTEGHRLYIHGRSFGPMLTVTGEPELMNDIYDRLIVTLTLRYVYVPLYHGRSTWMRWI